MTDLLFHLLNHLQQPNPHTSRVVEVISTLRKDPNTGTFSSFGPNFRPYSLTAHAYTTSTIQSFIRSVVRTVRTTVGLFINPLIGVVVIVYILVHKYCIETSFHSCNYCRLLLHFLPINEIGFLLFFI